MEETTINGEIYVKKSDIEKRPKTKFRIISDSFTLMDGATVIGIGSFQVGDEWITVCLSTEYLDKAIKILKTLSIGKNGIENIYLAWTKDEPAIIGIKNDKGEMSGVIIAPRLPAD